jgi:hypothetical protein
MGRLQANYNSSKNNKISIKKQNLGGGKINTKNYLDYAPVITLADIYGMDGSDYGRIFFNQMPIEIQPFITGYQIDLFFYQGDDGDVGEFYPPPSPVLLRNFPNSILTSPIISISKFGDIGYYRVRMRGILNQQNKYTGWSNIATHGTYVPPE